MKVTNQTQDQIKRQYEACLVEGRTALCPRRGIYKIIAAREGTWNSKPCLIASAYWKPLNTEAYSNTVFEVQLGTFNLRNDNEVKRLFDEDKLVGVEFLVHKAIYYKEQKSFAIAFDIIPKEPTMLEKLNILINEALKSGDTLLIYDDNEDFDVECCEDDQFSID